MNREIQYESEISQSPEEVVEERKKLLKRKLKKKQRKAVVQKVSLETVTEEP